MTATPRTSAAGSDEGTAKVVAAFAVIYVVWGTTYLGIRIAIETIPPFLMAGSRFLVAGLLIYGWVRLRGGRRPTRSDWKRAGIAGVLMIFGGNGLVTWSEQFIPSGFAALVIATIPIWMVVLSWAESTGYRPDRFTSAGIVTGLVGVALLSGAGPEILIDDAGGTGSVGLGVGVLLLAAISWSVGSLHARRRKTGVSLAATIALQSITGGLVLLAVGTLGGEWDEIPAGLPSLRSLAALGYLIVFGTLIAYSAYVWLLDATTPAKVGTYAYFNPLVALILGAWLAAEPVTGRMLAGAACILLSIFLVNSNRFLARRFRRAAACPD